MAKEIIPTILEQNFNYSLDPSCPVIPDLERVVNYDSDGNEYITFQEVDYPSIQQSHGSWSDWSLESLLKAGIDPAFSIHTGYNTRLAGLDDVNQILSDVDSLFETENK